MRTTSISWDDESLAALKSLRWKHRKRKKLATASKVVRMAVIEMNKKTRGKKS